MLSGCHVRLFVRLQYLSGYRAISSRAFERVLRRPVGGSTQVVRSNRGSDRVELCSVDVDRGGHTGPIGVGAVANKAFGARIHTLDRCMALGHCK